MEIEEPNDILKPDIQEDSKNQINYINQLLGIKINQEDLKLFKDLEDLSLFINTIKFTDKKKNEIKDKISEEIKAIENKESLQKLSEDKNKKFTDNLKLKAKTIFFHTAENDELSETMHAFYFCDKSKQIFSDKQEAEFKTMNFDPGYTGYDLPLPFGLGKKEEDNLSIFSNSKTTNVQKDMDNKIKLNKKRNKPKPNKKQSQEKMNASEDYNNSKNENGIGTQEGEYCISTCKYSGKSKGQPMIECDKCSKWYHTRCLGFTNEKFQKYNGKGKTWYCPSCYKMDIEDKND